MAANPVPEAINDIQRLSKQGQTGAVSLGTESRLCLPGAAVVRAAEETAA